MHAADDTAVRIEHSGSTIRGRGDPDDGEMRAVVANLMDYVSWRGDMTLAEREFTVVDGLVLCTLSYADLAGVVPAPGEGAVTVREAAEREALRERPLSTTAVGTRRLTVAPAALLAALGAAPRFAEATLSDHIDIVDPDASTQFSAVCIHLPDGTTFVAFRGTDNTIVGWQEDFTMSFQLVPAQVAARDYLAARLSEHGRPVRVGGHSKGGNLALYASCMLTDEQDHRVVQIYVADSPGLSPELADDAAWARIVPRLTVVVPSFSVIGMLFDRGASPVVVRSSAAGLMQHDPKTWQVQGAGEFVADTPSPVSLATNRLVDDWLEAADQEARRSFTGAFFHALSAGGATLIVDVGSTEFGSYEAILAALRRSGRQARRPARLAGRVALSALRGINYRRLLHGQAGARAGLLVAMGAFLVVVPQFAVQILGALAVLAVLVAAGSRLARHVARGRGSSLVSRRDVPLLLAGVVGTVALIAHLPLLVVPTSVLLGVLLLGNAWTSVRAGMARAETSRGHRARATLLLVSGAFSVVMALATLTTAEQVRPLVVTQIGCYLFVVGVVEAFWLLRDTYRPAVARASAAAVLSGPADTLGSTRILVVADPGHDAPDELDPGNGCSEAPWRA